MAVVSITKGNLSEVNGLFFEIGLLVETPTHLTLAPTQSCNTYT